MQHFVKLITEKYFSILFLNWSKSVAPQIRIIFSGAVGCFGPHSGAHEYRNHSDSPQTDKARLNINQFGQEIETLDLHILFLFWSHIIIIIRFLVSVFGLQHVMEFRYNFSLFFFCLLFFVFFQFCLRTSTALALTRMLTCSLIRAKV